MGGGRNYLVTIHTPPFTCWGGEEYLDPRYHTHPTLHLLGGDRNCLVTIHTPPFTCGGQELSGNHTHPTLHLWGDRNCPVTIHTPPFTCGGQELSGYHTHPTLHLWGTGIIWLPYTPHPSLVGDRNYLVTIHTPPFTWGTGIIRLPYTPHPSLVGDRNYLVTIHTPPFTCGGQELSGYQAHPSPCGAEGEPFAYGARYICQVKPPTSRVGGGLGAPGSLTTWDSRDNIDHRIRPPKWTHDFWRATGQHLMFAWRGHLPSGSDRVNTNIHCANCPYSPSQTRCFENRTRAIKDSGPSAHSLHPTSQRPVETLVINKIHSLQQVIPKINQRYIIYTVYRIIYDIIYNTIYIWKLYLCIHKLHTWIYTQWIFTA